MSRILSQNRVYNLFEYSSEAEFEKVIISHAKLIFSENSLYVDVKRKIENDNIVTIPDGYLIDFSFKNDPRLYIVENELVIHDPYKHIGQQLLKFAISYHASGRKIKSYLLENILNNNENIAIITKAFTAAGYRNIDVFFESLIFDKPISALVIIDEITSDLENVLAQLTMKTDVIEFQTYIYEEDKIHKFTPFQQDLRNISESHVSKLTIEELDTIIVPANEDGFNDVFLGEDCWYSIRIHSSMLGRIKYIASYQTAPISAITYFAEVDKIEKYKRTNKYIVIFKGKAKKIEPINLNKNIRGLAAQSPRYTSFKRLKNANLISDIY